jgi:general secretion pathway protein A
VTDDYYGFAEQPFSLTPDPRFFFRSESHERAFNELLRAIERREGFMLLAGDIGTGKTTLCRTLLEQLGPKNFTALVLNPFVDADELLKVVLVDLGVVSRDDVRRGAFAGASKQDLVDVLNQFLLSLDTLDASAVLVIDEAQNLPPATLEQIRVLSNLETNRRKLLQIVLVGQLNLLQVLSAPEMRQLNQRISRRCRLQPLTRQETAEYIWHRLRVARGRDTIYFGTQALDLIHRLSGGVPRVINMLCDRSLESAYLVGQSRISPPAVHRAAEQLAIEAPLRRRSDRRKARLRHWAWRLGLGTAAALAVLAGAWQVARQYGARPSPVPPGEIAAGVPATPPAPQPPASARAPAPSDEPVEIWYSIVAATLPTREAAEQARAELEAEGYSVRELVQPQGRQEFQVLVGFYRDLVSARRDAARLQQQPAFKDATIVAER